MAIDIDGERAIVGAPFNIVSGDATGAAYVFERRNEGWTEVQKLIPSDGLPMDRFGTSVAIDADTIVVGISRVVGGTFSGTGAAYVFKHTEEGWVEQQKLTASDAEAGDAFGYDVAIDGGTIVVGAWGADSIAGLQSGAAYVFEFQDSVWVEQQIITASDESINATFAFSLDISDEHILAGAWGNTSAYIFEKGAMSWFQRQKLIPHRYSAQRTFRS